MPNRQQTTSFCLDVFQWTVAIVPLYRYVIVEKFGLMFPHLKEFKILQTIKN